MKAIVCSKYGSPDKLQWKDAVKPSPKEDEVLIRVHAASMNSYDVRMMRGKPFFIRFKEGLFKPGNKILGADIAGVVEACGKNVTDFVIGDAVFGCLADKSGDAGFAEYACAAESVLAHKPESISFEQAASVPMAAVTALQGLRDVGHIRSGMEVLINGASGGVGTFAVQLAKSFNTKVTGVCSRSNMNMVHSIGADHVIDYTVDDFTQNGKQYDLILDIAANHTPTEYRRALKSNGICVVAGFSTMRHLFKNILFGKRTTKKDGKKIILVMADNSKRQDLLFMNEQLESGKVIPLIDGIYPLHEAAKAFHYFEKEHAKGKVILSM